MSYLKFSFTLFMVIASAFIMIYVVEGYYESLHTAQTSAPGASTEIPARQDANLFDKMKNLLRVREESQPETLPPALQAAAHNQPEVHHGICVAAMTGDLEKTKDLLDAGVSPNARDTFGIRAITRAALWGHYDVVKTLLDHGALVNEKERLGVTLLMLAANQGDEKLLRLFLERGAEKDVRSDDGETALTTAARKGHWNLVAILKESGAQAPENLQEPVLDNSSRANPESSSFSERLFTRNRDKNSERTYEVEQERLAVSPVKNESGIQVPREAATPAGEFLPFSQEEDQALSLDALTWAANVSQSSIQNEAYTFQEDEETFLPEQNTAVLPPERAAPRVTFTERTSQQPPALLPAQVSAPLDSEKKPAMNEPVPFRAVSAPLPNSVSSSVSGKARKIDLSAVPTEEEMLELALLNINEKRVIPLTEQVPAVQPLPAMQTANENASSPLPPKKAVLQAPSESARKPVTTGDVDFFSVKKLPAAAAVPVMPAEAPVQRKAPNTTALSRDLLQACLMGDEPRARKLIHLGADVNVRGDLEMTPLMIAAQGGHAGIVQLLLEKGADVRAQNIVGQTALRLAELRDRQTVIHTLRSRGASV